eukprot:296822-Rhodomonas_salina.1
MTTTMTTTAAAAATMTMTMTTTTTTTTTMIISPLDPQHWHPSSSSSTQGHFAVHALENRGAVCTSRYLRRSRRAISSCAMSLTPSIACPRHTQGFSPLLTPRHARFAQMRHGAQGS